MGRTIDADKLMDWFKEHNPFDEFPAEYICKIINEQPTVQPQTKCIAKITLNKEQIQDAVEKAKREILAELPRWTPVSKCPPEENMWTICQNNAGAMMIGKYDIEFGWMFPAYFDGIIAWQPLPAPYKEDHT